MLSLSLSIEGEEEGERGAAKQGAEAKQEVPAACPFHAHKQNSTRSGIVREFFEYA